MPNATPSRRRRRGDGSLYQAPDGRWRAVLSEVDPLTGRTRRRYLSGATEADTRAKLAAAVHDRDRGAPSDRSPTLEAWAGRWLVLVAQSVRPNTLRSYRTALRSHVLPRLGRRRLGELRPSDVERLTAELIAGGMATSTAALTRTVLAACLAAAVRDGAVARNVAADSRPPRVARAERRSLSPAELRRLLTTADEDEDMGPLVRLVAATGMRRGEALGLAWRDVDSGTLTIRRQLVRSATGVELAEPKSTVSRRTITLPAVAVAALDRRREAQDRDREAAGPKWQDRDGLIFTDRLGRPVHPVAFGSAFRRLVELAQLPGVTPHTLRHTTASALLAAGLPVRDVAESLGHSPAVLMRTYAHALPGSRQRIAAAMDEALSDG